MREMKFRAWDRREKVMCPVETLTKGGAFLVGNSPTPEQVYVDSRMIVEGDSRGHFCKMKHIELMQFTGFRDKDGNEIYEGDVVEAKCEDSPTLHSRYVNWSICFEDGGFCAKCPEDKVYLHYWTEAQLEVIGNIYQNPELIQERTS